MSMVRQAERPYTAADLAEMPDDGRRYELIGGELIVSPSPTERHQRVSFEVLFRVGSFVKEQESGAIYAAPFDVHLSEHDILQPDIVVISRSNLSRVHEHGIVGPPDLLVEVISPSSQGTDRVKKAVAYAAFGVPEYWLVDPDSGTMLAQELREGLYHPLPSEDGLIRSKVLDGLVIDPREIFAVPNWMAEIGK